MRSKFLFLFLLFSIFSFGQNKKELKQIEKQKEDFEVFKTSIFELETRLYRYVSKDSLDEMLKDLGTKVSSKVLNELELYKSYASITSQFQSGHTGILPTKHVYRQWFLNKTAIPIDVVVNGGKLYAYTEYKNVSEEKFIGLPKKEQVKVLIPEDAEIISIDNLNLNSWMERISKFVGSDENQPEFRYEIVKDLFEFFRGLTIDTLKEDALITFTYNKDTLEMVVPVGYPPGKKIGERLNYTEKMYKKMQKDFGSFKVLGGKYGYLQLPSFTHAEGRRYEGFLKDAFSKIQKKGIDELVIDLRGNTGGYTQSELLKYFLVPNKDVGEYRIEKNKVPTFKKFVQKNDSYKMNKKNLKKVAKWEKRTGLKYDGVIHANKKDEDDEYYLGKIVVLTDRSTFSAASILCAQLKKMKGAKIVGTTAGGSFYEGVAGTHTVVLPNSKFALKVNPNYYKTPYSNTKPFDQSIKIPDVKYQAIYGDPKKVDKKNERELMKALKKAFLMMN